MTKQAAQAPATSRYKRISAFAEVAPADAEIARALSEVLERMAKCMAQEGFAP